MGCNADILFCLGAFLYDKDKHDHSQYFFFNLPEQKAQVHFADQNLFPDFHYIEHEVDS